MTTLQRAPSGAQRVPSFADASAAQPSQDGKAYVLNFGDGLTLRIGPSGAKTWRCKAMRAGKQTMHTLGRFPDMKIGEARRARDAIRYAVDPAGEKRTAKAAATIASTELRQVAQRWIAARSARAHWTPLVLKAVERRLDNHVFPTLGDRAIADVSMDDVSALIAAIHRERPRTAVFVKQYLSAVFDYAVRWKMVPFNPVKQIAEDLPSRAVGDEKPRAFVGTVEQARAVLAAVEARARFSSPWTMLAHRLIALTGVRVGEALGARWDEFDLDAALWTVPAERMKGKFGKRRAHTVALAPQAVELVRTARRIAKSEYVFPSQRRKFPTMDRSTISQCIRDALDKTELGRVIVAHGWRGTFATVMNEVSDGASFRIVDVMLAHAAFRDHAEEREARKGSVETRYNHAKYRSARHRIACQWADMLLDGAPSAAALIGLAEAPAELVAPETAPDNVVAFRRAVA